MFQSKPSLPKIYDESSKKSDRDPRGAFRNPTDFTGAADGIVGPLGSSSFNLPNVERALSEMEPESDLQIHLLSKVLLGDLEAEQVQLSPLGTSSSPTSIGSVRSPWSPSANTGTPGATGQSQHKFCKFSFTSLISTNTRDRTANAAAASKSSAGLRTTEEQLTTIEFFQTLLH